jgi:hypothetical protein
MSTPMASSPVSLRSSKATCADEGHAATGDDAFFHGRTGRVQRVFHAGLLFLHLGLGGRADVDDGHAAGELGQAFLQLLAVVVGGGLGDLAADLADSRAWMSEDLPHLPRWWCCPCRRDALGAAEVFETDALELDAEVFGDALAAGQDGDVFHHGLAAVAEAGAFTAQT